MNKLIKDVDYYIENGTVVMTEEFHKKRGFCCGNGCRHCAYDPQHIKNNTTLKYKEDKKSSNSCTFEKY